jgi:hypothetical protein
MSDELHYFIYNTVQEFFMFDYAVCKATALEMIETEEAPDNYVLVPYKTEAKETADGS